MTSEQAQMMRINTVLGAVLMFMAPWAGLWSSDRSTAAVGFSAVNMALAPLACLAVSALGQAVAAFVARLLGDRVVTVLLGLGRPLFGFRVASTYVQVRMFPFVGFNALVTTRTRGQTARALAALVATFATLVGLIVAVVWLRDASWTSLKQSLATGIAWDALLVFACSFGLLWGLNAIEPTFNKTAQKARVTVGYAMSAGEYQRDGAYDLALAEARRGLEVSPDDAMLQLVVASVLCNKGQDALPHVEPIVSRADLPAHVRPLALNLWAWSCYLRGDSDLRSKADDASREALATFPSNASVLDTRGHVLLWNGRYEEAETSLKRAYELADNRSTHASAAAGMALLCVAKNRPDEAAMWLQRGRDHQPDNLLVARAIAAVEPLRRV